MWAEPVSNIEILQELIKRLHGCDAVHSMTISITEMFPGKTIGDAEVELFHLRGHARAIACYAWSYVDDAFTAVLKLHPVVSAMTAVKANITSRSKA
jgi:hypothetical protein